MCCTIAEEMESFTIRCGPGGEDEVVVSDEEATTIAGKCDYFQHIFKHRTKESKERILVKPDWSLSTTKQLVQLITTGKANLDNWQSFAFLEAAAEQVLLEITVPIPSFVTLGKTTGVNKERVIPLDRLGVIRDLAERRKGPTIDLEIDIAYSYLACDVWLELAASGITIGMNGFPTIQAVLPPKSNPELPEKEHRFAASQLSADDGRTSFSPGSGIFKYQVQAEARCSRGFLMHKLCDIFHSHREPEQERALNEGFSLRVPSNITQRMAMDPDRSFFKKLSSATGAFVYFHRGNSLGYYLDGSNDGCPTIAGTLNQIRDALRMLPDDLIETYSGRLSRSEKECKRCCLRIGAPTLGTLDRLAKAVHTCRDNPNTLGVDLGTKAFFAVKTVSDMKLLLDSLVEKEPNAGAGATTGNSSAPGLTLVSLNYPKGVF